MDTFITSFILGVITVIVYKNNYYDNVYNFIFTQIYETKDSSFQLASINLTDAEQNFDKVSRELMLAFENVGFAYLVDVNDFDPDELLYWTKWFFDQPLKEKMKIAKAAFNAENPNVYRGYFPLVQGGHSYKEAFEMGAFERENIGRALALKSELRNLTTNNEGKIFMRNIVEEKNVWPITDSIANDKKFQEVMQKYCQFYIKTSKLLFQLFVHGLGFEKHKFDYLFGPKLLSTFRLIHYPTRLNNPDTIPMEAWDGKQAIVTGEHFDTTMLTVLATFDTSGLQIKPKGYKQWLDVPADKDKLVINIGAMLAHMSGGRLLATNHRVIDIGVDRYSVPLFFEPCFDADVSSTFIGAPNALVGKYTKYGPWMTNRTSMHVEYATTDFGVAD